MNNETDKTYNIFKLILNNLKKIEYEKTKYIIKQLPRIAIKKEKKYYDKLIIIILKRIILEKIRKNTVYNNKKIVNIENLYLIKNSFCF